MKFTPKSEKDLAEDGLWPVGEYGFEVLSDIKLGEKVYATCDRTSKVKPDGSGGNEMIQLVLKVYNSEGNHRVIIDYLLESIAYKLRHAADACGLLDKYESGVLSAEDFLGKSGTLKLKVGKPNGDYAAKNEVQDYVTGKRAEVGSAPVAGNPNGQSIEDPMPWDNA